MASMLGIISVVKNEEKWVYYSLSSLRPLLDMGAKYCIIDGNSTDRTQAEIKRAGFNFETSDEDLVTLRNRAADTIGTDWIWWIDADEVWTTDNLNKVLKEIKNCPDHISILNSKYIRFVGDRYHYDGIEYRMPRIYKKRVRMYGKSFPVALDALAESEDHLEIVKLGNVYEARNNKEYIKDIDATFYHYAECNTRLDRMRKWYGYIKNSNKTTHDYTIKKLYEQKWGINSTKFPFDGEQPEVFNV